jgi:hypothetical protein
MATTTATIPVTLQYEQEKETSVALDWAKLVTLDLSKFDQPGGKHELAAQFTKAIEDVGMLCLRFISPTHESLMCSNPCCVH